MLNEVQREVLFVGARAGAGASSLSCHEMSGEEAGSIMLDDMNNIQDKTEASIQRTKQIVAASKQIGDTTLEEQLAQREQTRTIGKETDRVEENLNTSDKLIKRFGRRIATDRFIQCFACINILLLMGVVVYAMLKKGGDGDTGSVDGGGRLLRGFT